MSKKKIIALLLCLPALSLAQDKFEIVGKLSTAGSDKKVILSYVNSEGKSVKDSTLMIDGNFFLSGNTAYGNKAYLSLLPVQKDTSKVRRPADYQTFYLEGGKYRVVGNDSLTTASISGTEVQRQHLLYESQMGAMLREFRQISQEFMKRRSAKDSVGMKALQPRAIVLRDSMEATLDRFIFAHPDSYVTLDLINENKTSVIQPEIFDPYYSILTERVLSSFTGKMLTEKYNKARQIFIGKPFDFTQEDSNGNMFSLSSMKGKYVLIDFWASWCAPCREENPNILSAYNKLKDKGFEVVGISLDDSKPSWINAIKKDGMPWVQVSDLKGWKNDVAVKYGITAVPQNVIIDPNGIIIAKNLRGEDLYEKLEELIVKKVE